MTADLNSCDSMPHLTCNLRRILTKTREQISNFRHAANWHILCLPQVMVHYHVSCQFASKCHGCTMARYGGWRNSNVPYQCDHHLSLACRHSTSWNIPALFQITQLPRSKLPSSTDQQKQVSHWNPFKQYLQVPFGGSCKASSLAGLLYGMDLARSLRSSSRSLKHATLDVPLSCTLAFLYSLSRLRHLSVHIVGERS